MLLPSSLLDTLRGAAVGSGFLVSAGCVVGAAPGPTTPAPGDPQIVYVTEDPPGTYNGPAPVAQQPCPYVPGQPPPPAAQPRPAPTPQVVPPDPTLTPTFHDPCPPCGMG